MDWKTLLTLVVGAGLLSGLVTAILNIAWDAWTKSSEDKRSATYLAIRLAVILEQFAMDSADRITDQDLYDQTQGNAGASPSALPELEPFPGDQSWSTLPLDLLARVLTFPNERRLRSVALASWMELSGGVDFPEEYKRQCGTTGYRAWALAHDLRKQYRLHPFDPRATSWDFADKLKGHHDDALRHEAEVRQTHGKARAEVEDDGSEWGIAPRQHSHEEEPSRPLTPPEFP